MKKLIYSMLVLALIAMTFVSCEDVPAPYNTPTKNEEKPQPADPKGTGTQADPFNVTAAHNFIKAGIGLDKEVYVKNMATSPIIYPMTVRLTTNWKYFAASRSVKSSSRQRERSKQATK